MTTCPQTPPCLRCLVGSDDAHHAIARAVDDILDPPIFRAVADDHELCVAYPCADCIRV